MRTVTVVFTAVGRAVKRLEQRVDEEVTRMMRLLPRGGAALR